MPPSDLDFVGAESSNRHCLRFRGAPDRCYVISDYKAIDEREMPLAEAIWQAEWSQMGTLISCLPGRLVYYYDESGARRMLLERRANSG